MRILILALIGVTFLSVPRPVWAKADASPIARALMCAPYLQSPVRVHPIELEQINLRRGTPDDLAFFRTLVRDPANRKYFFNFGPDFVPSDTLKLERQFAGGEPVQYRNLGNTQTAAAFDFIFETKATHRAMGVGNLIRSPFGWEIGFALLPEYRGQGHARDLVESLYRLIQEIDPGAAVVGRALESNIPSRTLLLRNGFNFVRKDNSPFYPEPLMIFERKP